MGDKIIRDRKSRTWERKCRIWRLMLREGIGYHTYLGIPERPTGQISINILWTFPHGASAYCHAPVQLSGLLSFTCHSCVTHAAPLFVQTNMVIKLTESPVPSRWNKTHRKPFSLLFTTVKRNLFSKMCLTSAALPSQTFTSLHKCMDTLLSLFTTSTRSSFIAVRKNTCTADCREPLKLCWF